MPARRGTRGATRAANRLDAGRRDYAAAQTEPQRFGSAQRGLLSAAAALGRRDPAAADALTREATAEVLRIAGLMAARLADLGPRAVRTASREGTL